MSAPGGAGHAWNPGDVVALRYITRNGLPGMSWACRVVGDSEDLVALFVPRGATYMRWAVQPDGSRRLDPGAWRRDVLRLMFPGEPYSIWLFWEEDEGGGRRFTSYYVNMEEPFRRTSIGFDTNDHMLDVVVAPDRSWRWKDEEEFADRIRGGIYSAAFGDEVRSKALEVVARLESGSTPFCDGWEAWTPDPDWAAPEMPAGWDTLPATLWSRRAWAYLDTDRDR